jgi:hypothetical protein
VIVVTNEEAMSMEVGDLRHPEGAVKDVSIPSPDPPIGVDPRNYNPTLEPAPAAVPLEQHTSSSQSTLDDPLSNTPDLHFLGFCLRPMEDLSPSSRTAFVDEIVHWTDQSGADEEHVESTLFLCRLSLAKRVIRWGVIVETGKGRAGLRRSCVFLIFCSFSQIQKRA